MKQSEINNLKVGSRIHWDGTDADQGSSNGTVVAAAEDKLEIEWDDSMPSGIVSRNSQRSFWQRCKLIDT